MTTKPQTLDEILRRIHVVPTAEDIGDIWAKRETDVLDVASAKQEVLRWVDEVVIGKDFTNWGELTTEQQGYAIAENNLRINQRAILKAEGYKDE